MRNFLIWTEVTWIRPLTTSPAHCSQRNIPVTQPSNFKVFKSFMLLSFVCLSRAGMQLIHSKQLPQTFLSPAAPPSSSGGNQEVFLSQMGHIIPPARSGSTSGSPSYRTWNNSKERLAGGTQINAQPTRSRLLVGVGGWSCSPCRCLSSSLCLWVILLRNLSQPSPHPKLMTLT